MNRKLMGYRTGCLKAFGPQHIVAVYQDENVVGVEERKVLCGSVKPWVALFGVGQPGPVVPFRTAADALAGMPPKRKVCRRCSDRAPRARAPQIFKEVTSA